MSASLYQLLKEYAAAPEGEPWVAATVVSKYKSSYRKPGALMLVDPLGGTSGLISGGCLESDVVLQARRVKHEGRARCVVYDSTEEGNIAAELGLGCNGRVEVLIQELGPDHRRLLLELLERLEGGRLSRLLYCFDSDRPEELGTTVLLDENCRKLASAGCPAAIPPLTPSGDTNHRIVRDGDRQWSLISHNPPVSLWVIGGGVDARPMVSLAATLGWRVTVVDHRVAYGRPHLFPGADAFIRRKAADYDDEIGADAVLLMSHNQQMDADWLARLSRCTGLRYTGLLGPVSRKEEVIAMAGIEPDSAFARSIHGPMGFDIGGDLPESIAVSVIAQCHRELALARRL